MAESELKLDEESIYGALLYLHATRYRMQLTQFASSQIKQTRSLDLLRETLRGNARTKVLRSKTILNTNMTQI